ncbi:hypothetical protein C8F01DRAFT_1231978 [Mycena amicta]|nr:hypothetical protein C8F01DRAFT_1231978 [Mycena amicta]
MPAQPNASNASNASTARTTRSKSKEPTGANPPVKKPVQTAKKTAAEDEFASLAGSLSDIGESSIVSEDFQYDDEEVVKALTAADGQADALTAKAKVAADPNALPEDPAKLLARKLATKTATAPAAQSTPASSSFPATSALIVNAMKGPNAAGDPDFSKYTKTTLSDDKAEDKKKGKGRNPVDSPNPFLSLEDSRALAEAGAAAAAKLMKKVPNARPPSPKQREVIFSNAGQRGAAGRRSPVQSTPTSTSTPATTTATTMSAPAAGAAAAPEVPPRAPVKSTTSQPVTANSASGSRPAAAGSVATPSQMVLPSVAAPATLISQPQPAVQQPLAPAQPSLMPAQQLPVLAQPLAPAQQPPVQPLAQQPPAQHQENTTAEDAFPDEQAPVTFAAVAAQPAPVFAPIVIPPVPAVAAPANQQPVFAPIVIQGANPAGNAGAAPFAPIGAPAAITLITPPAGGYPRVFGWNKREQLSGVDPAFANEITTRAANGESIVMVYPYAASHHHVVPTDALACIKAAIASHFNTNAPLIISAPYAGTTPPPVGGAPFQYFILGLPNAIAQMLAQQQTWNFNTVKFFAFAFDDTNLTFYLSLTGWSGVENNAAGEDQAKRAAAQCILTNENQEFLFDNADALSPFPQWRMQAFVDSMVVKGVTMTNPGGLGTRVDWNVMAQRISAQDSINDEWHVRVASSSFRTTYMDTATVKAIAPVCDGCKSFGHGHSMCAYFLRHGFVPPPGSLPHAPANTAPASQINISAQFGATRGRGGAPRGGRGGAPINNGNHGGAGNFGGNGSGNGGYGGNNGYGGNGGNFGQGGNGGGGGRSRHRRNDRGF